MGKGRISSLSGQPICILLALYPYVYRDSSQHYGEHYAGNKALPETPPSTSQLADLCFKYSVIGPQAPYNACSWGTPRDFKTRPGSDPRAVCVPCHPVSETFMLLSLQLALESMRCLKTY